MSEFLKELAEYNATIQLETTVELAFKMTIELFCEHGSKFETVYAVTRESYEMANFSIAVFSTDHVMKAIKRVTGPLDDVLKYEDQNGNLVVTSHREMCSDKIKENET